MGRTWKAVALTDAEWSLVENQRREAERRAGQDLTKRDFLLLMANDTSAKWRRA